MCTNPCIFKSPALSCAFFGPRDWAPGGHNTRVTFFCSLAGPPSAMAPRGGAVVGAAKMRSLFKDGLLKNIWVYARPGVPPCFAGKATIFDKNFMRDFAAGGPS
jgi:hypothetical protein